MANSIRLSFGFRDVRGIVANLHAADVRVHKDIRRAVRDAGDFFHDLAFFLAPVDTGFMRSHLRTRFSEDGLVFEGGFREEDFRDAGLAFYPPFVEDGTTRQRAQPFLRPAFEETVDHFGRDLSASLRRSLAQ